MERIKRFQKRMQNLSKALNALKIAKDKILQLEPEDYWYISARDSLIQSFEFTIDLTWKVLKEYIEIELKLEPKANPKGVVKDALENKIITIDDYKLLIKMFDYRNLTSHTYEEDLAEELSEKIILSLSKLEKIINKFLTN